LNEIYKIYIVVDCYSLLQTATSLNVVNLLVFV